MSNLMRDGKTPPLVRRNVSIIFHNHIAAFQIRIVYGYVPVKSYRRRANFTRPQNESKGFGVIRWFKNSLRITFPKRSPFHRKNDSGDCFFNRFGSSTP
jgi:hypothetical protein